MTINANQKGKRVERELAALLREMGFPNARRTEQYNGNDGESDVLLDDGLELCHIESKGTQSCCVARSILRKWYEQIERDNKKKRCPVVFFKGNSCPFVLLIPVQHVPAPLKNSTFPPVSNEDSICFAQYIEASEVCNEGYDAWCTESCKYDLKKPCILYKVDKGKFFAAFRAKEFLTLYEVLKNEKNKNR